MAKRSPIASIPWLLLAIVLVGAWMAWPRQQALPTPTAGGTSRPLPPLEAPRSLPPSESRPAAIGSAGSLPEFMPPEARDTIALIQRDGPFPHRQDGAVFGNREGHLPRKPRGWYREYTVDTPRLRHRGARRIVTGGDPPSEWYYSDDHYDSFRRFQVTGETR